MSKITINTESVAVADLKAGYIVQINDFVREKVQRIRQSYNSPNLLLVALENQGGNVVERQFRKDEPINVIWKGR